jgi:hypothetical protein
MHDTAVEPCLALALLRLMTMAYLLRYKAWPRSSGDERGATDLDRELEQENSLGVEWLILADYAEVNGGKLYLMGGGWEAIGAESLPVIRPIGIAAGVRVPWTQTNQRHTVEIEVQDEDAQQVAKIDGQFEVGRPPGIPSGQPQRFQLAMNMHLSFQRAGGYLVVARLNGKTFARTPFRVFASYGQPGVPPLRQ